MTFLSGGACMTGGIWIQALVSGPGDIYLSESAHGMFTGMAAFMSAMTVLALAATVAYTIARSKRGYIAAAALYALPLLVSLYWIYLGVRQLVAGPGISIPEMLLLLLPAAAFTAATVSCIMRLRDCAGTE